MELNSNTPSYSTISQMQTVLSKIGEIENPENVLIEDQLQIRQMGWIDKWIWAIVKHFDTLQNLFYHVNTQKSINTLNEYKNIIVQNPEPNLIQQYNKAVGVFQKIYQTKEPLEIKIDETIQRRLNAQDLQRKQAVEAKEQLLTSDIKEIEDRLNNPNFNAKQTLEDIKTKFQWYPNKRDELCLKLISAVVIHQEARKNNPNNDDFAVIKQARAFIDDIPTYDLAVKQIEIFLGRLEVNTADIQSIENRLKEPMFDAEQTLDDILSKFKYKSEIKDRLLTLYIDAIIKNKDARKDNYRIDSISAWNAYQKITEENLRNEYKIKTIKFI